VKNVVLPLVLVITLSLVFGAQEAFAVIPNCTVDDGTIEKLTGQQMYIANTAGQLAKLQIGGLPMTDKGKFCIVGDFKVGGVGSNKKCTDIGLDPSSGSPSVNWPLYCVTFKSDSSLYSVDRKTADLTFIGKLEQNGNVNDIIKQINTFEIDTGGLAYAGGFDGRWWQLDLANGHLTIRKDFLVDKDDTGSPTRLNLSGDAAYDLDTATMLVTAQSCAVLHDPASGHTIAVNGHDDTAVGCAADEDGLYSINLVTNVVSFVSTTGESNAFAMDMRPFTDGNLCLVTKGGTLTELQIDGTFVSTSATTNIVGGGLLFANGGTALQQLVGGILDEINKFNLLIDLIFS